MMMIAPANLLKNIGHALGCTFLPASCLVCSEPVPQLSSAPVCSSCWSELTVQRANCCLRCGEDLFEPLTPSGHKYCRACRLAPPAFVRAVSHSVYIGAMRSVIHALKYDRVAPLAQSLGQGLAGAIAQLAEEGQLPGGPSGDGRPMLVVPVPLHRTRLGNRGFNQARTLATAALRVLARTHPAWKLELSASTLVRKRATESQSGLSPRQRRLNLRGAFFVSDTAAVSGRHVLLIDDVYTTGATARACSRMLIEAGAASVRVATLARAQRRIPARIRDERKLVRLSVPEDDQPNSIRIYRSQLQKSANDTPQKQLELERP